MPTDSFTVTVADDYGQATSTVTVDIADPGVSFLTAGDVSTTTPAGTTKTDIDVVAAASASADLLPIVVQANSLTTPSPSGTATLQANGKLSYAPATGVSGITATFDFTLKPSAAAAPTDVGTVSVQVTAVGGEYRPEYPSAATKTTIVTTSAALQTAYNNAQDGEHIVCADGPYAGNFTFNRIFSIASPVVIKAASINKAVFSGQFNVTGSSHHFHEIKTTKNGGKQDAAIKQSSGSYLWVTRCWIHSREGIYTHTKAHHAWIGWNRFTGEAIGGASSQIFIELPSAWSNEAAGPHHIYIYNNYFTDATCPTAAESHNLYFGESKPDTGDVGRINQGFVEYNLFHRNSGDTGYRKRAMYLKRGCTARYNHTTYKGSGSEGFRHSRGGDFYGNRITGDINVNGGDYDEFTRVWGNAVGGQINLYAGSYNPDSSADGKGVEHQAADHCELSRNQKIGGGTLTIVCGIGGDVRDDTASAGGKLNNVKVYAGGYSVSINRDWTDYWIDLNTVPANATAGNAPWDDGTVQPVTLTPSMVGQRLADQSA